MSSLSDKDDSSHSHNGNNSDCIDNIIIDSNSGNLEQHSALYYGTINTGWEEDNNKDNVQNNDQGLVEKKKEDTHELLFQKVKDLERQAVVSTTPYNINISSQPRKRVALVQQDTPPLSSLAVKELPDNAVAVTTKNEDSEASDSKNTNNNDSSIGSRSSSSLLLYKNAIKIVLLLLAITCLLVGAAVGVAIKNHRSNTTNNIIVATATAAAMNSNKIVSSTLVTFSNDYIVGSDDDDDGGSKARMGGDKRHNQQPPPR